MFVSQSILRTPSSGTLTTNHKNTMQTENDTSKPEDSPQQEAGEGCQERLVRRDLVWHPGPAIGGGGTAEHEDDATNRSWWYDGQLLLVIVERNDGPEVSTVRVHADGDMLDFSNAATGDYDFGWTDQDISWWAILDDILPTNNGICK
jgi:hypothetical protein